MVALQDFLEFKIQWRAPRAVTSRDQYHAGHFAHLRSSFSLTFNNSSVYTSFFYQSIFTRRIQGQPPPPPALHSYTLIVVKIHHFSLHKYRVYIKGHQHSPQTPRILQSPSPGSEILGSTTNLLYIQVFVEYEKNI